MAARPGDVGIVAMDCYFPSSYVSQADLEGADGVPKGKYTVGLGQTSMSFATDREDVNSLSLSVVQRLFDQHGVSPVDIGRVEVGTETLVDKSKSTKTVLMDLFKAAGNTDVEGATVINACYGGTAALFNAVAWVESSAWDGRLALVVAADIAIYAAGPARPSGGCGAVAMLVGPDAVLILDPVARASTSENVYDFFKPIKRESSEYPEVDGKGSQACYLAALDCCYHKLATKLEQRGVGSAVHGAGAGDRRRTFSLANTGRIILHSPYNKLLYKAVGRLAFVDLRRRHGIDSDGSGGGSGTRAKIKEDAEAIGVDAETAVVLAEWSSKPLAPTSRASYADRPLDMAARGLASKSGAADKVRPSESLSKELGNCYTAALYLNLLSLLDAEGGALAGERILAFSYGSGLVASCFLLRGGRAERLEALRATVNLPARLAARHAVPPEVFAEAMTMREEAVGLQDWIPAGPLEGPAGIAPGAFYLDAVRPGYQRMYLRRVALPVEGKHGRGP